MRRALAVALLCAGCKGRLPPRVATPGPGGDAQQGAAAIHARGCGACHIIPGIREARGEVGPQLAGFARRSFIAGHLPNSPENLVRWLRDPPDVDHGTAMPKLGLDAVEARDIAAYLYTLDSP